MAKKKEGDYKRFRSEKQGIDHAKIKSAIENIETEVDKAVIGQKKIIHDIIRAILCNGHVLVEGVPGVAKTLIIKSIASDLGCGSKRIQFTVDLLPTDITGIQSYTPKKGFEILKGPIFTHFVLADEINRSPPKTQSALLEAMQEKAVTIARQTHELPRPFFVMATENPLENSGVYELPEAQIDRFLFKLIIDYPEIHEEKLVLDLNMTTQTFESFGIKSILAPEKILKLQEEVKKVYASDIIKSYIVEIVNYTRKKDQEYSKYVSYGASPRASIALFVAAKAEALMDGRDYVIPSDVIVVSKPVLRHRIMRSYQAEAENISSDYIIEEILKKVRAP